MRWLIQAGSTAIICLSAAQASAAPGADGARLDVLGIHYADDIKTADATLVRAGFRPDGKRFDSCDLTFDQVVQRKLKGGRLEPTTCHEDWKDSAGRRVLISGAIHFDGFRVSTIEYSMPYTGSTAQLAAELEKKFGRPKGSFRSANGPIPVFSIGADIANKVSLRAGTSENIASITLEPIPSYRDSIEADKLVANAVAKKTGGGALKL